MPRSGIFARLNITSLNNLIGWFLFVIAFTVYFITMEDTGSYWDPGEFIAVSYKLQVPHPPGAPLFLLLGRIFSFLSFGDPARIGWAVNLVSVVAGAFTIMFMYWSLVHLGRKLGKKDAAINNGVLLGAAALGALAYAFTESFWFSAVEAEVYALSSFFTAFGVWAILKWETSNDERDANRWLILIAYMLGLSIGVHLLNLLTIPVICLIYYFKKYKVTGVGFASTLVISGAVLMFVNAFMIQGLPSVASKFELLFVNSLGLFFGSGVLALTLLVVASLVVAIRYSEKTQNPGLNVAMLCLTFLLIGYGSYATIVIRAGLDTPINENAPKDVMSFVSYLKREQYGSWPVFYGPYFSSRPIAYEYGTQKWKKGKDRYEPAERDVDVKYRPGDETLLPRAWDSRHAEDYKDIMGLKEGEKPTFAQNINYMIQHQIGTMYMRYFMWNFAGRENDEQGAGWLRPAQWFKELPPVLASNKARNNFFMIPFLLGLIGMYFQFVRDTKNFAVVALLFMMLGLAIVIYLNSPPTEPRERDYIYAGSFYAYALWIGMGIIAIAEAFNRYLQYKTAITVFALSIGAMNLGLLATAGWNDHDRSNRYFSTDAAMNLLKSCDENAVIFTGGDNDTFPLWYAQDAEGCRTDLRVLVLSYCNTDWYIEQTTRRANKSEPFRYTIPLSEYRQGGPNDILPIVDASIAKIDGEEYLRLLAKQFKGLRQEDQNVVPSKVLTIKVDKDAIRRAGIVPPQMDDLIVDEMQLRLTGGHLEKNDLVFLDMLISAEWKRPVYVNPTSLAQLHIDLRPYAVMQGNAYRILPVRNPRKDRDFLVDTGKTYDLMVNQFKYRGLDDPGIYYTEDYKMQVMNHRLNLNSLAEALIDQGDSKKAEEVIDFSLTKMPVNVVTYDPSFPDSVNLLYRIGKNDKATRLAMGAWKTAYESALYQSAEEQQITLDLRKNLFMMDSMQRSLYENGEFERAKGMESNYDALLAKLQIRIGEGTMR
jgi:hypothetical protein